MSTVNPANPVVSAASPVVASPAPVVASPAPVVAPRATAGPPVAGRDWTPWPEEFAARHRAAGHWRGETFAGVLRDRAAAHPDRIAVVDGERRLTYAELHRSAERMAAGLLTLGVTAGDRVVVQLPNRAEFLETIFGLFRIGALPVFALPAHREAELRHFCAHSDAVALIVPDRHDGFDHRALAGRVAESADPAPRHVLVLGDPGPHTALADVPRDPADLPAGRLPDGPEPGDLAFLQLSGGSTGVPKLIPRTHDDYLYSVRGSNEICGVTEESVYLCALPAAHNFPLSSPGTLGALYAGGRVVMCPAPNPDTAFPLIEREGVTITGVVPPLALAWTGAVRDPAVRARLAPLRTLLVGGAKFTEEAARRVRPALGCDLVQVFGMAEGLVNYTRADDPADIVLTTQGRPISPDDEIRIVDDADREVPPGTTGHLLTRGPYTIRGYWRAPEHNARSFTADGFYRTGDLVRRLPTGHLVVEGRAKDQINRGGEKIAAAEVENVLLAHPAVHDAQVVAVPDDYLGERTCAYLVLRPGEEPPKPAAVRRFVRERGLAAYKIPDIVRIVESFPETGVGKVSKKDLRVRDAVADD
ncbi:(2,3-dihydroxybenzoyl)adenylate synthase [Streptomyces sp. ST2-7A]|uniref:(2,3-dihydroxybenzoyl)adenylate synthase n=1 Tax=Streptomyces sp. ST2-7A TaxID=2907214 RepID=UPI001F36FF6B|nr:AMP-binding protein [Streptomyces sp. ST2-7A]MCE7082448.1 AMP-binding protein [Streptomyces sp. ST2-7A]